MEGVCGHGGEVAAGAHNENTGERAYYLAVEPYSELTIYQLLGVLSVQSGN